MMALIWILVEGEPSPAEGLNVHLELAVDQNVEEVENEISP